MIIKNNRWKGKRRFIFQLLSPSFLGTFNKKVDSVMIEELKSIKEDNSIVANSDWASEGIDQVLYYTQCVKNGLTPALLQAKVKRQINFLKIYLYSIFMFLTSFLVLTIYEQYSNSSHNLLKFIFVVSFFQLILNALICCHRIKQIEIGCFFKRKYLITNIKNITALSGPLYIFNKIAFEPRPLTDEMYKKIISQLGWEKN
ncbi:hypothetical protein VCSRO136_2240 [Vibrio cholerae]|nr:hypothetical protein VCSRO136_2240 [Vibrio cholerae]